VKLQIFAEVSRVSNHFERIADHLRGCCIVRRNLVDPFARAFVVRDGAQNESSLTGEVVVVEFSLTRNQRQVAGCREVLQSELVMERVFFGVDEVESVFVNSIDKRFKRQRSGQAGVGRDRRTQHEVG
jgi:hypothetical protein